MVSKITITDIANYIRLSELDDNEKELLTNLKDIAIDYIKSYTGLTDEEIDKHKSFVIVVYTLCQYMYDHRAYQEESSNLNKVVETILGMHCVNLI